MNLISVGFSEKPTSLIWQRMSEYVVVIVISVGGLVLCSPLGVVTKPGGTGKLTLVEDVEGSLATSDGVVSGFSAKELVTFKRLDYFYCFLNFHGWFVN